MGNKILKRVPKRLAAVLALVGGLVVLAAADYWYWTDDVYVHPTTGVDSYIRGKTITTSISGSGYIYVHFVTASTNSFGTPRIRVKVTDANGTVRWNATYLSYANSNQQYDIQIPAGPSGTKTVSLYGVCDQSSTGPTQVVLGYTEIDW